jgi:hypothetical protein
MNYVQTYFSTQPIKGFQRDQMTLKFTNGHAPNLNIHFLSSETLEK